MYSIQSASCLESVAASTSAQRDHMLVSKVVSKELVLLGIHMFNNLSITESCKSTGLWVEVQVKVGLLIAVTERTLYVCNF